MGALMARKNLLQNLMGDQPASKPADKAPAPRYSKGAIGAVSKSIADLKSRSIVDVVADQIDNGGLRDRLEDNPQDHEALVASIRDYGQQVPVLLRLDPNHEGRYQVVYGRRRVAALK
jgi:ParB family chromosome partitioning protein